MRYPSATGDPPMLFVDGLIACFIWNDLHHPKLYVEEIAGDTAERTRDQTCNNHPDTI
jgi:hypothetical protein